MLHNAYPNFVSDEFSAARGSGVILFDPRNNALLKTVGDDETGTGPWTVRSLAFEKGEGGIFLWVGTFFDGAYKVAIPGGTVREHYTLDSTGISGRAVSLSGDGLVFKPDTELAGQDIKSLQSLVKRGLYLRLNTETFQVTELKWPEFKVYTYGGSHDPLHAGRAGDEGLDKVVILTGLPNNIVNDIMTDGDTIWFATGLTGDKGLSGGLTYYRDGRFNSLYPNAVFNKKLRFHRQHSNVALAVTGGEGRVWSGWSEIRGFKPWGGVSGNLISFTGHGLDEKEWRDLSRRVGVNAEGYAPVLHTSVPALAPVEMRRGDTVEQCVAAGTFFMNNALKGMGYPGRHAWGGGGLRVICDWRLRVLVAKSFDNRGRPEKGSPPSNAIFAIDVAEGDKENKVFAVAGTDAGLYFTELNSQYREYFYEPPQAPEPAIRIGSNHLLGEPRTGEVLHGLTVGAGSWPPCLPDLFVQDVLVQEGLTPGSDPVIWAATYRGLARYAGPIDEEALTDCGNWSWYLFVDGPEGAGVLPSSPENGGRESGRIENARLLPVSAIDFAETNDGPLLAIGTGYKWFMLNAGVAISRIIDEAEREFHERPVTHVRLLYSTVYENPQESVILSDHATTNLYTQKFHEKECDIDEPRCLAGDTALNWSRLDRMVDEIVALDLTPTFCISTFPFLVYRDFVKDGPVSCRPPDPERPECSPSRTKWDFRKWENMIFAIVDHFYGRYGRERVSAWTVEVWNEPAVQWLWPWTETWAEDYAELFKHTQRAIRACDGQWDKKAPGSAGNHIRLAGPAWHGDPALPGKRLKRMMRELEKIKAKPDILTAHVYTFQSMDMTPWYERAQEIMRGEGFSQPLAVTEYGPVMAMSHDGIGTLAASELSALFLVKSLHGLYQSSSPPEMMYMLDIQSMGAGPASNWPGVANYLGTGDAAPRPLFNLMTLAAQAGKLPLDVETDGDVSAFGRYDSLSGKIMIFAYRTRIEKPWKQTIDYQDRGEIEIALDIKGLKEGPYRVREFKIDSKHANSLTALWRAGSPDQPAEEQVASIKRESKLAPLPEREKFFPDVGRDVMSIVVIMEDDSICVVELTPREG
jgi:hypothetical protein